jgi:hypothetical protein
VRFPKTDWISWTKQENYYDNASPNEELIHEKAKICGRTKVTLGVQELQQLLEFIVPVP